ncbi:twin arginine-targeting protein translocase TatB [Corynebacterium sp. HMSC077C02]|uniref:Sec-independent protein translocase protein TatB n=1 Tax=Corynebacterium sp. HMSC077C02 TaxID=1739256 RepID=UPI0008A25098|nr:Sec-independent protein translocase protein TatB [Corynebacterium sp. HMSC077C02]OFL73298.1 twin arginine-targeting protein translocase TatB [Corynebacterium sp. HMSC077C02]
MFSNVGWGEILVLFILGLILIGPERLPKVIEDVRALLLAARTAINDARDNLSDEFGEDFDDLRKPLQELNDLRRLNPKTAITRTLFDGDDTYLDMLSGKPAAGGGGTGAAGAAGAGGSSGVAGAAGATGVTGQQYQQPNMSQPVQPAPSQQSAQQPAQQPGTWQDPVAQARQQQAQQTPQQSQQPQQPQQPRGVQAWVDDDNL